MGVSLLGRRIGLPSRPIRQVQRRHWQALACSRRSRIDPSLIGKDHIFLPLPWMFPPTLLHVHNPMDQSCINSWTFSRYYMRFEKQKMTLVFYAQKDMFIIARFKVRMASIRGDLVHACTVIAVINKRQQGPEYSSNTSTRSGAHVTCFEQRVAKSQEKPELGPL
jgi:hypothetical protein